MQPASQIGNRGIDRRKRVGTALSAVAVLFLLFDSVGKLHAETGGMLGGDRTAGLVTHFHFDTSSRRSGVTYSPDYKLLTKLLTKEWNPNGVQLIGFVHSHPAGCEAPSGGDRIYAADILKANDEIASMIAALPSAPVLIAPGGMSQSTASIC